MSDGRYVTRTTYSVDTSGCLTPLLGILVALAIFTVLLFVGIRIFVPDFDGQIGAGCDPGNEHCTYSEWRKGCSDEDVRAHVCNLPEYQRSGGR